MEIDNMNKLIIDNVDKLKKLEITTDTVLVLKLNDVSSSINLTILNMLK